MNIGLGSSESFSSGIRISVAARLDLGARIVTNRLFLLPREPYILVGALTYGNRAKTPPDPAGLTSKLCGVRVRRHAKPVIYPLGRPI
jgi:hypothetical protein